MNPEKLATFSFIPFAQDKDEKGKKKRKTGCITMADNLRHVGNQRWLWERWIPLRAMTLILGEAGVGKSRFALSIAKTLSTGGEFPDNTPSPYPEGSKSLYMLVDGNYDSTLAYLDELYV
jgi:hypothetical protein